MLIRLHLRSMAAYRAGMTRLGMFALFALFALLLTACGNDEKGDDAATPVALEVGGPPACSDVWVAGQTLPETYAGCEDGGSLYASAESDCKDGRVFTTFNDRFYAVLGAEITAVVGEMSDDPAYSAFFDACFGG